MVDWGKGASGWNYNQAVANTRLVGTQVGLFLQALEAEIQISLSSVHIIGFSLGAHISGYAGQIVSGLGRISGIELICKIYISEKQHHKIDDLFII